ncbi:YncE family protein [Pinibacter soli]|uniref:YncE family protein n=1 Tax=Pinibacter soli TaxID=3044211 RepID=A0ABT6RFC4_9BACT|nr:YncE family protein [Pinibacter soli]MDI3321105.1 YncE family protein [Pinibacter soli]
MTKELALSLSTGLILSSALFTNVFAQDKPYHLVKTFHIASAGGWDYLAVNNNKLYVSHGTQVNILDKTTGDSVGVIPNTTGVHGIAFDNALNKGYTSNGKLNSVTVFDLTTNNVQAQILVGENPDAIMLEPFSKKVITCNGRSKDLSVIDPQSNKVVATIALDGKPETAVSDGEGKVFVNIEDKSEIAVINIKTMSVEAKWSIAPGEAPTGLAFDKTSKRLFAGCDNKLLIVTDATNGKTIAKVPIGEGCDGVAFDNESKTIFASNGEDGTMTVIKEKSANSFEVINTVATKKGARTIAIDEVSHAIYLPTADFVAGPHEGKRPPIVPGSFEVLVYNK